MIRSPPYRDEFSTSRDCVPLVGLWDRVEPTSRSFSSLQNLHEVSGDSSPARRAINASLILGPYDGLCPVYFRDYFQISNSLRPHTTCIMVLMSPLEPCRLFEDTPKRLSFVYVNSFKHFERLLEMK
jgi:hypothetical protein